MLDQFNPRFIPGAEDVAEVVLRFPESTMARMLAGLIGQRKVSRISFHVVDKLIEIGLLRRDVTVYRHASDHVAVVEGRGIGARRSWRFPKK